MAQKGTTVSPQDNHGRHYQKTQKIGCNESELHGKQKQDIQSDN